MPRVRLLRVHVLEPNLRQHPLDVDRYPRRLRQQRPRRVLRALVNHERERDDVHGAVLHLRILPEAVPPLPALRPRLPLVRALRDREHVRREVHPDHPRGRERVGDVPRADPDGAPHVDDQLRLRSRARGVPLDVRSQRRGVRVAQSPLRLLRGDPVLRVHPERHRVRRGLRLERGEPAQVPFAVRVERLEVIRRVLDVFVPYLVVERLHRGIRVERGRDVAPRDAVLLRGVDERSARHGLHEPLVQELVRDRGVDDLAEEVVARPVGLLLVRGERRRRRRRRRRVRAAGRERPARGGGRGR
eukprot:31442-Pelagococcus_subviridis.AAC.5